MPVLEKIEKTVVEGYQKIEKTVVEGYQKIEDGFVEKHLMKKGESVEEAKERFAKDQEIRSEKAKKYANIQNADEIIAMNNKIMMK